jgi:N-hydroxyarylamine O-acetyltransferase
MLASNFDLNAYFQRIGFTQEARADLATVTALMRCQLRTVPFENLDVQAGKIVSLIPEEIVEKIVQRQRGGYCYEVNGLFAMALHALGLPYQFVAARPMFYPARRPKTHMGIVVTIGEEQYLCDLGFGSYGIRAPLHLGSLDVEIAQDFDCFKLSKLNEIEYLMQARVKGEWLNQYSFNLSPQEWIDFMPANYLNSTHPDAIFVQKYLIIKQTETGRVMLVGDTFKRIHQGEESERKIADAERSELVRNEFGLVM